jgi:hypothetical protein
MLTTAGPTCSTTLMTACEYASSRLSSFSGCFDESGIGMFSLKVLKCIEIDVTHFGNHQGKHVSD